MILPRCRVTSDSRVMPFRRSRAPVCDDRSRHRLQKFDRQCPQGEPRVTEIGMSYHRFVVLGDSCAEGLDDPYPDQRAYRGWADFVAARLAQDEPGFRYANLAVRGRRLDQIVPEQVPAATRL